MIGSTDQEVVKEAIPILTKYLGDSDSLLKIDTVDLIVVSGLQVKPEVWIRDAALMALGDIGEKNPELVKESIPMIVSCLRRPESYTRRKAIIALGQIGKNTRSLIEPYIKHLKRVVEEDSDDKVRLEAKRVYESLNS